MKRFLFIIIAVSLLAVLTGPAEAQTWYKANQVTVAWDPVSELVGGTPIPATDVVRYFVFIRNRTGDQTPVKVGDVLETEATITLANEIFWFVGVQAARYVSVDGIIPTGDEPETSEIAWSDNPQYVLDGKTFGVRHHVPPGQIKNLRIK